MKVEVKAAEVRVDFLGLTKEEAQYIVALVGCTPCPGLYPLANRLFDSLKSGLEAGGVALRELRRGCGGVEGWK